jgi:hypothetical protein
MCVLEAILICQCWVQEKGIYGERTMYLIMEFLGVYLQALLHLTVFSDV